MSRIKWNVLANLTGGVWTALLSIVFIPFYLRYLGIEAYGLIGLFATLQAIFGIFDFGMGATLTRGMARLSAEGDVVQQRHLVRTFEAIYWCIALATGIAIVLLAGPIARTWVNASDLSEQSITSTIRLMGLVCALQFPFALYKAGLMGLQKQVLANVVLIVSGTVRTVGAVVMLAWVSPTIEMFFLWQVVAALGQTAVMFALLWRQLAAPERPRFRRAVLSREWQYAAGVSLNAIIGMFLTQSDKVLLSGLLPLSEFGAYTLAGTVANSLWWLIVPINTALFPRFAQLSDNRDEVPLRDLYHTACQMLAVLLLPVGAVLALFSREVLLVWTGDPAIVQRTSVIAAMLVVGTLFNALASIPGYLASAAGWPQLTMYTNLVAAIVILPAIAFATTRYGAIGAATVWLALNFSYVVVTAPLLHRRLLVGEWPRWLRDDVVLPALAVVAVGVVGRLAMPALSGRVAVVAYTGLVFVFMSIACAAVTPRARAIVLHSLRSARERLA